MATIEEINAKLKRVNIKGKDYVEVPQRVQGFRELFPSGTITTEWLILEKDWCVCQATVAIDGVVVAQGSAFEERKGNINTTSYIENCETSAVGRALGFLGIGSAAAIASADEVRHAMAQQNQPQEESEEGVAQRGMVNAFREVQARGFSKEQIQQALQAVIPGKTSKEYTTMDKVKATQVLKNMIKEA